jgi:hypothetical protein
VKGELGGVVSGDWGELLLSRRFRRMERRYAIVWRTLEVLDGNGWTRCISI